MANFGGKSRETYERIAETHQRLGDKNWAAAKENLQKDLEGNKECFKSFYI